MERWEQSNLKRSSSKSELVLLLISLVIGLQLKSNKSRPLFIVCQLQRSIGVKWILQRREKWCTSVGWNLYFCCCSFFLASEGNQRQRESKVVARGDADARIGTLIGAVMEAKSPNCASINTFLGKQCYSVNMAESRKCNKCSTTTVTRIKFVRFALDIWPLLFLLLLRDV